MKKKKYARKYTLEITADYDGNISIKSNNEGDPPFYGAEMLYLLDLKKRDILEHMYANNKEKTSFERKINNQNIDNTED